MNIRNTLFPLFVSAIVMLMAGCKSKSVPQFTKLTDYLYEITLSDVDETYMDEEHQIEATAACSSVRYGNFHGRNLDLFYNEGCEVVLHVPAAENRFASVGVCGGSATFTPDKVQTASEEVMRALPYTTLDGVNEKGVVVNVNVVPAKDMPIATGTNPGARRVHMSTCPRYILDHAESAAHAVELLKQLDLYGGFGKDFGLHLMISDAKETYIVELIDNQLQYTVGTPESPSNIMTNLYSTLPELTEHADGVERYKLLQEHITEGVTENGMINLMQRVRYTKTYEPSTSPFWFSEYTGVRTAPDGSTIDITIHTDTALIRSLIEPDFEIYRRHERKGEFWQTVHTSVYNIEKRELTLFVQEDYDNFWHFSATAE